MSQRNHMFFLFRFGHVLSLSSGLQSTGGDEGSQGGATQSSRHLFVMSYLAGCSLTRDECNLPHFLEWWGMKQDAYCMVLLRDLPENMCMEVWVGVIL